MRGWPNPLSSTRHEIERHAVDPARRPETENVVLHHGQQHLPLPAARGSQVDERVEGRGVLWKAREEGRLGQAQVGG